MAQVKDLIVSGAARFLNTINGNITGTASNVTGTVAIANGGTGATTNATARANLLVPCMTTDQYPTILTAAGTNNWIKIGTSNTNYGLLPSTSGGAGAGHNYIGTSSWYWKYAYIDEIYGKLNGNCTGSSGSCTGNATTATTASKLGSSNVGSATQPIYLNAGTATACTYSLGKSVPSNAVFTDHYAWSDITGKPSTFAPTIGTTNTTAMAGNTNVNNVTQTAVTSGTYKLLVSGQNDTTTRSEGVNKCSNITVTATGQIDITSSNGSAIWGTNNLKLSSTASNTLVQVQHLNSNKAIDKYCNVSYSDIDLSSTWDGTNTSLKSAIGAKANAASPTITGNMTMSNGSISMSHNGSIIGLSAIELYCPSTSGNHGGFIDFHWNQNTADYTARLIETGSKGTIKAYNSISNASDRRLKDNIVDIDDKYVGLLNIINAKQYNFKSSEDKIDLGFIAQEVEDGMKQIGIADDKMPIISKPTDNDVDKYYGLDYSQMTALLWKICQVQQKEIDELKNK